MIYLLYSFLFFFVGFLFDGQQDVKKAYFVFYYWAIVLFWGVSYIHAPDTVEYIEKFHYDIQVFPGAIDTQYEIGYTLLAMLFKTISPNYWLFQLFIFGVEVLLILKSLKNLVDNEALIAIIPLLFFIYPSNLAAFRQGIAVALFIYALPFINADTFKRSLLYFVFIFLAFLFHQSALLLIIVYPLRFLNKLMEKDWLIYSILIIGDVFWITGNSIIDGLDIILPLLNGNTIGMGEKYSTFIESFNSSGTYGLLKLVEVNFGVILYTKYCNNCTYSSLFRYNLILFLFINLAIGGFLAHRLSYYWDVLYYVCFFHGVLSFFTEFNARIFGYLSLAFYMFWLYIFKNDFINNSFQFVFGL